MAAQHLDSLTDRLISVDMVVEHGNTRYTFKESTNATASDLIMNYKDKTALVDRTRAIIVPGSFIHPDQRAAAAAFADSKRKHAVAALLRQIHTNELTELSSLNAGQKIQLGRGIVVEISAPMPAVPTSFRGVDAHKLSSLVHLFPDLGGTFTAIGVVSVDNLIGIRPDFITRLPKAEQAYNAIRADGTAEPRNALMSIAKNEVAESISHRSASIALAAQNRAKRGPLARAVRSGQPRPRVTPGVAHSMVQPSRVAAQRAAANADRILPGSPLRAGLRSSSVSSTESRISVAASRVASTSRSREEKMRAHARAISPVVTPQVMASGFSKERDLSGSRSPARSVTSLGESPAGGLQQPGRRNARRGRA